MALSEMQLCMLAGDVAYEVNMLVFAVRKLQRADLPNPSFERNLFIEGAAIHSRNLLEFFHEGKPRPSDLRAADFLMNTRWDEEKPKWFDEYKKRCNKLVAHLTHDRTRYAESNDKDLHTEQALRHVLFVWKRFVSHLSPERRAWFDSNLHPNTKAMLSNVETDSSS